MGSTLANDPRIEQYLENTTITVGSSALPTGASTAALQTTGNGLLTDIKAQQTSAGQKTQIVDGSGNVIASSSNALAGAIRLIWDSLTGAYVSPKMTDGKLRVINQDYLMAVAEGDIPNHEVWTKIGYNADCGSAWEDLWQVGGTYVAPTAEMQLEVTSSSANDAGSVGFSGTATSGSTTTLVDTGKDFTAGTPVVAGDIILLDDLDAFGVVTSVAATTLTCSGGFCGGVVASGAYRVIDVSAGGTGAQVCRVKGLDGDYAEIREFVVLNGTGVVATTRTDWFRINSWRVIVAGAGLACAGTVDIRHLSNTPIYSRMVLGDTRARNIHYTVPAGKNLFVTSVTMSSGSAVAGRSTRMVTRATYDPSLNCALPQVGLFVPFTEVIVQDSALTRTLEIPTKLPEKTDLKVSVISPDGATYASCALRGWIETA